MTAQPALYHLLYVPQEEVIANNGRMSRKTLKKVPCEQSQKKVPCEHAQKKVPCEHAHKKVPCEHARINMLFRPPSTIPAAQTAPAGSPHPSRPLLAGLLPPGPPQPHPRPPGAVGWVGVGSM
jgi:hypothetical protein